MYPPFTLQRQNNLHNLHLVISEHFVSFMFYLTILLAKRGRPEIPFVTASSATKRRRVQRINESFEPEALLAANKSCLKASGKKVATKVLDKISDEQSCIDLLKKPQPRQFTPSDAVALMIECNLTQCGYEKMRRAGLQIGNELYPSYKQVFMHFPRDFMLYFEKMLSLGVPYSTQLYHTFYFC